MKNKVWLFTAALLLFTAGCGKTDLTEKEINGDEQKTIESQETEKTTEKDGNASGEKKSVTENETQNYRKMGKVIPGRMLHYSFQKAGKTSMLLRKMKMDLRFFRRLPMRKKKGWDTFLAFRRTRNGIRMLPV